MATKKTGVALRVGASGLNVTVSMYGVDGKRAVHRMSPVRARLYAERLFWFAAAVDKGRTHIGPKEAA